MKAIVSELHNVEDGVKSPGVSFEWLVTLCSAFGMSVGVGFLFSIKSVNPSVEFSLGWQTWVSMVVTGWLTYWGCRVLLFPGKGDAQKVARGRRWWFFVITFLGFGTTAFAMAYSLRGISREKLMDVGLGVLLAAFFLSIVAMLFLRTIRFLRADEAENAIEPDDRSTD